MGAEVDRKRGCQIETNLGVVQLNSGETGEQQI